MNVPFVDQNQEDQNKQPDIPTQQTDTPTGGDITKPDVDTLKATQNGTVHNGLAPANQNSCNNNNTVTCSDGDFAALPGGKSKCVTFTEQRLNHSKSLSVECKTGSKSKTR